MSASGTVCLQCFPDPNETPSISLSILYVPAKTLRTPLVTCLMSFFPAVCDNNCAHSCEPASGLLAWMTVKSQRACQARMAHRLSEVSGLALEPNLLLHSHLEEVAL